MISEDRKHEDRLNRQFDAIGRVAPPARPLIDGLLRNRYRWLRMPAAFLLIVGGFLAILPIFGLWMIPVGLLLLAVDVPALRPYVSAALIRVRRRLGRWGR